MQRQKKHSRVFAVVLAAGKSRRFGGIKQLADFDGERLVTRAARSARESCGSRSVLVTGYRAADVSAAAGDYCQFQLVNEHYEQGMGTSIALAAHALGDLADAILLLLADQPLVSSAHLRSLLALWSGDDDEIVATAYGQAIGPPVLLPCATFVDLKNLSGDLGARSLFADDRYRLRTIRYDAAGLDVDTRTDLERARGSRGDQPTE